MFKLLKWIVIGLLLAIGFLAVTGQTIGGKTVGQHVRELLAKKDIGESLKDIRVLVGEAVKAVGQELSSDEVTDDEKKQLDRILAQELKEDPKK